MAKTADKKSLARIEEENKKLNDLMADAKQRETLYNQNPDSAYQRLKTFAHHP